MTAWHLRGMVLPDEIERDVYVVDGRFAFDLTDDPGDVVTLAQDVYLLPGLVDVHAHLSLASPAGDDAPAEARVRASARAHLDAGVLAVREPGSPDHASQGLGPSEGLPRVVAAGRFLAPPGRYFPGLAREVTEEVLPTAALEELAAGSGWVKLIGDFPTDEGLIRTFGDEALRESVHAVHDAGGRVAVHCLLPEVIQAALDAGVDSLEHATFLRSDQVRQARDQGTVWVPTCTINASIKGLVPDELAPLVDAQPAVLREAEQDGVTVLAGTDAGMGPHGQVRGEVQLLLAAGLSPDAALAAASWKARSFLGLPGIEPGAPADLTAYRHDPREAPEVLSSPVVSVLDGRVVGR